MAERMGPLTYASRPTHCDVCERELSARGQAVTAICAECVRGGAAFATAWMQDLEHAGHATAEVAAIVGTTPATVRARRADRNRRSAHV